MRGGGGCQHYKEEGRVAKNIVPRKPDLVFIGGISQTDVESIREVIRQLRAGLPEVEILLATGTFGSSRSARRRRNSPRRRAPAPAIWRGTAETRRRRALRLSGHDQPWAEYLRSAKVHPHVFYRDRVHANEFGEQILSKILMAFFEPSGAAGNP